MDQDQKTLQAEIGTGQAFHAFRLTVLDGPESGRSLTIDGSQPGPWLLGHAEGCHLRLTDQRVSRRHVSCEHIGTAVRCVDQRSLNGTLVNGLRIESCLLRGGERIAIGDTTIFVEALGDAPTGLPVVTGFGGALGASLEMRRLYPLLSKLAKSDVPLLIEGETGTGKEAVAKAIHSESRRASGPFVVLDCTSTPASLFESELLGHEKGAFTGAMQTRRGCMEMARGGTLFIDELGDLDLALQARLLRAVEAKTLRRVGGEKEFPVDVRLVCATRRDLDREVQQGRFREDLYFRLAVSRVHLPPLRHRKGDVRFLAVAFWHQLGGAEQGPPASVLERWEDAPWPGNVRELKNAVARTLAMGEFAFESIASRKVELTPDSIEAMAEGAVTQRLALAEAREQVIRRFERLYVERLSLVHPDDVDAVAKQAGVTRRYLNMLKAKLKR